MFRAKIYNISSKLYKLILVLGYLHHHCRLLKKEPHVAKRFDTNEVQEELLLDKALNCEESFLTLLIELFTKASLKAYLNQDLDLELETKR